MPRNLTGETYALVNADRLQPKQWGPGQPFDVWWPEIEARLAKFSAVDSPFVEALHSGRASREVITAFIKDLVILAKELPLHETRIAASSDYHGENTVLILSHGPALALGYAGYRYLPDLAREFAAAWGLRPEEWQNHELSRWPKAYLNTLYDFGRHTETGIAATLVDAQLPEIANRLRDGLIAHYGVTAEQTEVFEALAAMDGRRAEFRPVILRDIAQTAYHQSLVKKAVITTSSLWRRMWDAWENPTIIGLTFAPALTKV